MQNKVAVMVGVVAAVIIAGCGFYIVQLKSDLAGARQEIAAITQKSNADMKKAQQTLADMTTARDDLKVQLQDLSKKLDTASMETEQKIAGLEQEVARLKAGAVSNGRIAGYWRDLFDYSKRKNMPPAATASN